MPLSWWGECWGPQILAPCRTRAQLPRGPHVPRDGDSALGGSEGGLQEVPAGAGGGSPGALPWAFPSLPLHQLAGGRLFLPPAACSRSWSHRFPGCPAPAPKAPCSPQARPTLGCSLLMSCLRSDRLKSFREEERQSEGTPSSPVTLPQKKNHPRPCREPPSPAQHTGIETSRRRGRSTLSLQHPVPAGPLTT